MTVIRWVEVGLLRGTQKTKGASWRIQVSEEDRKRLRTAETSEGWLTLKEAASKMGVSQQTILQRLKDGKLEGIRAHTGRRVSWRIRLFEKDYEDQRGDL